MKTASIRLENFQVFRDLQLRKIPAFLVLVGANGLGKTTLPNERSPNFRKLISATRVLEKELNTEHA